VTHPAEQPTPSIIRPDRADIEAAYGRIRGGIRRTPVIDVGELPGVDARVLLKLELLQHSGSFKARGALNNMLALAEHGSVDGVCAASGGNHAGAVAWAAAQTGITADLFVPARATPAKIARIEEYGGKIHLVEGYVKRALVECEEFAQEHGVPQIHPYDRFETIAGAGTMGLEIGEQVPGAAIVVLGCGGGGLYAGTAIALEDVGIPVQPVEPELCPSLADALAAGEPVEVEVGGVASDSLGAAVVGRIALTVARERSVRPVLISDAEIVAARRYLWQHLRVLAEPGACVALASVLGGQVTVAAGETIVVVVSGGNNETLPD
jgi:threonine dehydratase